MASAGAAGAVAAAAAAAAERVRREEEQLATYRPEELEGFEFKFLRSAVNSFRDPGSLRRHLDDEAAAGWELVEKFDDQRLRLKRRIEWREKDHLLDGDPYRTWVGITPGRLGLRICLVILIPLILLGIIAAIAAG